MSNETARRELISKIQLRLGEGIIDLELDYDHYNFCITQALERYRQRSPNAVEESYVFLELQPEQTQYILPREIIEVRQIFRRGTAGTAIGTGVQLDPFGLAFNNLYLLQATSGATGGLLTYELYAHYQEAAGRMFGLHLNFAWSASNHKLTIMRYFRSPETVLLWTYNYKPDESLINDIYGGIWIRDYAVACAKLIMAEARSKYSQIAGPQGGVTLNGDALKTEAAAEMERLEKEIATQYDGNLGYGFIIG